jgi:hypothetical protein
VVNPALATAERGARGGQERSFGGIVSTRRGSRAIMTGQTSGSSLYAWAWIEREEVVYDALRRSIISALGKVSRGEAQ